MGDVEIDIVGPEPLQALLDLVQDCVAAEIAVNRLAVLIEEVAAFLRVPDKTAFGGDHGLVAAPGQGLADDLLRAAKPVGRRGIDQRYAGIERSLDCGDGFRLVRPAPHPAADRPCAEPDRRGGNAGCTDLACQLLSAHAHFPSPFANASTRAPVASSVTSVSR
ncbi:hypothetical protein D3C87_1629590 [compost metagenome]